MAPPGGFPIDPQSHGASLGTTGVGGQYKVKRHEDFMFYTIQCLIVVCLYVVVFSVLKREVLPLFLRNGEVLLWKIATF